MRPILLLTAATLLLPAMAAGQTTGSLEHLQVLRDTRTTVTVTDVSGSEFRGKVLSASSSVLSLQIGRTSRQFTAEEIRLVRARKEDSLRNGALIGAAVGAGLTSLVFLDNECYDDAVCFSAVVTYGAIGSLIGAGIDALIHRDVPVYRVAPLAGNGRRGVRITFTF